MFSVYYCSAIYATFIISLNYIILCLIVSEWMKGLLICFIGYIILTDDKRIADLHYQYADLNHASSCGFHIIRFK